MDGYYVYGLLGLFLFGLTTYRVHKIFFDLLYPCRYLSALISQSFLDIGSVSRILDGIMKLCLQFCWKIESQEIKESTAELEHIAEVLQATFYLQVY